MDLCISIQDVRALSSWPETYQEHTKLRNTNMRIYSTNVSKSTHKSSNMLSKWSPGRPWGEVLEPTSGHWEKEIDFESILEPLGPVSYTHLTLPTNREV